jgi:hypothetical protein
MDINQLLSDTPGWAVSALYAILALASVWTVFVAVVGIKRGFRTLFAALARRDDATKGAGLFYLAAVAGMAVSVDTSWLFFGDVLGVNNLWVRGVMFFVLELAQIACGWGMRASMRQHARPGPARLIAWTLCAVSAYMAWSLSGFWVGIARVVLGPILSLIMLHLALGIEVRKLEIRDDSMWLRLVREFRERFLALFGLSDEGRDAKTIARDRARAKAIRIRMTTRGTESDVRQFVKALSAAGIMDDPIALEQFQRGMQLATNARTVWGADYGMPFPVSPAIEAETAPETVEIETETPQVKTVETAETKPVSLAVRGADAEAEVDTLLQLIVKRDDPDALKLPEAQASLPAHLSRATVARRLATARERFKRGEFTREQAS